MLVDGGETLILVIMGTKKVDIVVIFRFILHGFPNVTVYASIWVQRRGEFFFCDIWHPTCNQHSVAMCRLSG